MVMNKAKKKNHPLETYISRLINGEALLGDSRENMIEVVGILHSYGIVLDAYSRNLIYVSERQFLVLFPFFKYFDDEISWSKLLRHWWHDRINFEYAEYCMKTMFWHGGGGLDAYVDTPEFQAKAAAAIKAKIQGNPIMEGVNWLFPEFLPEQVRMMVYYSGLGQFWRVMSDIFMDLSAGYDSGKIQSIPQVVEHIKNGLVAAANKPITYKVKIRDKVYEIVPESLGMTFLADTAIPYVEAVFFRGTPFLGTVSYNAQAGQISPDLSRFAYGALYADPLPVGSAGIPPTLLMQDMRHYLPDYLADFYQKTLRGEDDLRVKICRTFQKSMFCVTSAAILGLAPYPLDTEDSEQQEKNRAYLLGWMDRFLTSQLDEVNK
ncbi:MAG TPA: carbon dioxide transporter [Cyanobacteria bacterium UBA11149]|nr:carbon dioxide transporter [Cyanobacteria bacterium UBA11367]HBE56248.1 carbon dioxide transporter [Cyanobacteria bacterium UBA11366]HBK64639.1 carbon dioxide transporter [Cyanobacteria bacterium UBA11166]HBR76203.1 carbon dioxide transporter [Cyanobacteria bacterium UBA11159]HBS68135.1 carbon dioxide transporter [Cyanobacteria bacterium UBA11153]HBW90997.1 carbon dioxide transporter [Cyanobacteria bacterium UBA11149]HCA95285.1 carbon dioxide transporter [Cyanobacteria bacterium UBA9226]